MAVARASVADIRSESLAVRAAWQPGHLRWLLTWQCGEPTTIRARVALLHLSTATGSTFVFRLRGPSKVISPSSRFKISSDSCIDIDSLFGCLVLRAFRSLLRRSRRREHEWLGEGIGSVVVAPFPVTLTMCVTVKANALNEERVRGTDVDVRANTGFVVAFAQCVTKTWRLKKRTCGKLWGRPARRPRTFEGDAQGPCMSSVQLLSARRRTFEHCTSCCPPRCDDGSSNKKKKRQTTPLTTPRKDLLRVGANVGSEMFSQVRTLAADRVSPPVSNWQNNHLAPSCRLSLKKLLRAASSLATIGARSSFSGARLAHDFPRSFLVAAIIFPHTKWLKKMTDYRDTPALK